MEIHHLALRTRDVPGCAGFYRDVLGLAERARRLAGDGTLRAVWLAAGAAVVMIERAAPGEPGVPPGALDFCAFAVTPAEREVVRARLATLGVALEAATEHTLYVRDPDGRRVGVSSYPLGSEPAAGPVAKPPG